MVFIHFLALMTPIRNQWHVMNALFVAQELAISENNVIADVEFLNATNDKKSTSIREADASDSPVKNKRRKVAMEPSSLSEQEQIALAIGNSLREVGSNGGNGGADGSGDEASEISDDDDDGDFDFGYSDDERSTQSSAAKEPQSQPKVDEIAIDEPSKTTAVADTYERYLGDDNGKFHDSLPSCWRPRITIHFFHYTQTRKRAFSYACRTAIVIYSNGRARRK